MQPPTRMIGWFVVLLVLLSPVFAAEVLTNDAVVALVKAGLAEDVIIAKVRTFVGVRVDQSSLAQQ